LRDRTIISYYNYKCGFWIEFDISNKYREDKFYLFDLAIRFVDNHKFTTEYDDLLYENGVEFPLLMDIMRERITLEKYNEEIERIRKEYDYLISGTDMGLL